MGFDLQVNVPALTVFLQGLVSFFSPCVLPLIPLYLAYLSGEQAERQGRSAKLRLMVNTLFFVLGISATFFLLGLSFTALGSFFRSHQALFTRGGGILIIVFGLFQLFERQHGALQRERRFNFDFSRWRMSPPVAFVMGFAFSFAWTPCVGPTLASVLLMVASASNMYLGLLMILVYTAGFVLPFLLMGLFTDSLLRWMKAHMNIVRYTTKIGAVLMIVLGLLMFTGKMNSVSAYLSRISPGNVGTQQTESASSDEGAASAASESSVSGNSSEDAAVQSGAAGAQSSEAAGADAAGAESAAQAAGEESAKADSEGAVAQKEVEVRQLPDIIDFTLTDQYGKTHKLSDYKGKTVFLNFWATWCPPCRSEMPDIQKLYEKYKDGSEVVVIGVAGPNQGQEQSEEGIKQFLQDNGYTYPVLMDTSGQAFMDYQVYSLPTTYMINTDSKIFGYISGALTPDMMQSIVDQTISGKFEE